MPEQTLYHFTTVGALQQIASYGYLKCLPAMPPRWADRRPDVPECVYLTEDDTRSGQRWAGVPSSGRRGISYLDRAAGRIAVNLSTEWGTVARRFRSWALDYDIPLGYIDEFAKGADTGKWWVVEREVVKAEWLEIAFWNGLRFQPTFTRVRQEGAPWPQR